MEGNRSPSRKRPNPQFTGNGDNKRGRQDTSSQSELGGNSDSSDTVYRILCQSSKIGSVIGKGGTIVKGLREKTRAKISIAYSFPGSDERLILIHSPAKIHGEDHDPVTEKEDTHMKPHCPAQDALLKVHDRIISEDLVGGPGDDNETEVTARLLVPNNMVGCILGRKGDVIQRLRTDTGASIRVLPAEHLPSCAQKSDELVQISGKPGLVKTALYEVSTLLHQNPKKDNLSSLTMPHGTLGFRPHGRQVDIPPPGSYSIPRDMPPVPWEGGYRNPRAGFGRDDFNDGPLRGGEVRSEFAMKIVCPASKIGGIIGKGGANVKRLQQETEAAIKVGDVSGGSEERVIRVSAYEDLQNPRSPTIDAILLLQEQTRELSEKEIITTRLLVQSSKVGCLLGQGGHIINEMRKRTLADIRVYAKKDKPKYAADNEELVQIAGNVGVAKDALAEIALRLRERCLREAAAEIAETEPAPIRPPRGFDRDSNFPHRVSDLPGPIRGGGSSRYEFGKGDGREYELSEYPAPPSASRYSNYSRLVDVDMPNDDGYGVGRKGILEIPGRRSTLHEPQSGGSRGGSIPEFRSNSEYFSDSQNRPQHYMPASEEDWNPPPPPQGSRQNYSSTQHGTYSSGHSQPSSYQNMHPPPQTQTQQYPPPYAPPSMDNNPHRLSYENVNANKSPYPDMHPQRQPPQYQDPHQQAPQYQNAGAPGSYRY